MNTCRSACLLALLLLLTVLARAQKPDTWLEVRSPHFIVVSNASEKQARSVAEQFELFRALVKKMMPKATVDLGKPLTILAVKNEKNLKELLPEFWEEKGRAQPAGVFVGGEEKLYVALRLDVYDVLDPAAYADSFPYQVIYHEYMHAILRRNFQNVPVWLSEGLCEFFGHTVIRSKQAGVGRASSSHIYLLRDVKPLPIETLLTVDQNSPHYNEQNKASVFYAQSWALTHYLLLEEKASDAKLLEKYQQLLGQGLTAKDAAEQTFGDLQAFAKELSAYVRRPRFRYIFVDAPPDVDEKAFPVRALSPAESAALRGDFHVHMNRPAEARALLDEALRLDPENAQAYESIGVLHLRNREHQQAAESFEKAAARNSRSFLAHYYAAMLGVESDTAGDQMEKTEQHLRRAIELNPQFAPAHATLAGFLGLRNAKLEEALALAQKAAQLEPGNLPYHLNVAHLLMRMRRMDEALALGEKLLATARDADDRDRAEEFLRGAREFRESSARYEAARRQAQQRDARQTAEMAARPTPQPGPAPEDESEAASELTVHPSGAQATARGLISAVTCTGPSAMQIKLRLRNSTLTLRAAERAHVPYYIAMAQSKSSKAKIRQFDPCKMLDGQRAEIVYKPAPKNAPSGEIMSVELLASNRATFVVPPRSATTDPPPPQPPGAGSGPRVGWAEGKVLSVACAGPVLRLVIDLGGGFTLKLRAADHQKLQFAAAPGVNVPEGFQPCTQLKGLRVETKYHVADAKTHDGDIVTIQIRK